MDFPAVESFSRRFLLDERYSILGESHARTGSLFLRYIGNPQEQALFLPWFSIISKSEISIIHTFDTSQEWFLIIYCNKFDSLLEKFLNTY